MKKALLGHNLEELKYIVSLFGLPSFTAKQIADWLYKKRVKSIDDMTNLSKSAREKLSSEYEVGRTGYSGKIISTDGTKKYLFMIGERGVETVMIPDDDRYTICVSSQVGCKMGCKFCMTGRQGFHGHLSAAQILSQFMEIDESANLTNAVFMGMGEPLDNYSSVMKTIEILTSDWGFGWSPKRITLSTIGVLPTLKNYLDDCKCHLAVSLHDPFADERLSLMPMQKPFPIEETVKLIKQYDFTGQRRVSFEYIMFSGINDTKKHADALVRLLSGLECRINLIRFHKIPDSDLSPSPMPVIETFKKRLNDAGIITTLRASRGEDVLAACGMLAGK
ncbi:MAG: 23S rRNA (adenine(2503)-C(2))-methyltransferase RlmN [Bacteroidales bacterium]|nr:23S rRNA (adenine(2503)-C(2))-methyltransferase RlmN [Bacteroidales bacterium]